MKAISIRQPWAELIASGEKKVEYRSWRTRYRGPLLICASQRPDTDNKARRLLATLANAPLGVAVCVVDLLDVTGNEGAFEWYIENPRRVEPVPVKGKLGLWVPDFDVRPR